MLFRITVLANNTRGPRYMEKSLAAMHEARLRHSVTLIQNMIVADMRAGQGICLVDPPMDHCASMRCRENSRHRVSGHIG